MLTTVDVGGGSSAAAAAAAVDVEATGAGDARDGGRDTGREGGLEAILKAETSTRLLMYL